MFKITFELNGKPVQPGQLGNAFQDAVLESVQEHVTEKLSSVRCPEHGSAPTVVCTGRSLDELTFKISGCCQKLIDTSTAALS